MSESADRHSMSQALQGVIDQGHDSPDQAVSHVLDAVIARLRRGIDDARLKGASETQLVYLVDFAVVLGEKLKARAGKAAPATPAPAPAAAVEEPPAETPEEPPVEHPAEHSHSKKGKRN